MLSLISIEHTKSNKFTEVTSKEYFIIHFRKIDALGSSKGNPSQVLAPYFLQSNQLGENDCIQDGSDSRGAFKRVQGQQGNKATRREQSANLLAPDTKLT